ncbi:Putative conidiospore surface protein [Beauveria bassiana ARSEF 2860]|uniref:Putative conidiospore surface protein n=1 Tax=Beauveria bassiana (strain ARSEF 2860) TaxID=655819 RepID=J4USI0_BEAB2|nr:Putative conidiospore surface protein [Beauveria bassiana ARSEF 2860]EJP68627.1 Putative conidiospore surface protein [Beauveria bassiana ARSEF 2860]
MWSLRSTSSILTVLCQLCSVSSLPSTKLATPQSGDTLAHLQGSTSPEATYTTKGSHFQNGIGFSKREDSPAAASGASYRECFDGEWWCQYERQCIRTADQCNGKCPADYYFCNKSRRCIHYSQSCTQGCDAGSWWCDVANRCIKVRERCAGQCDTGYWWCNVARICVPVTDQCAGKCRDGWHLVEGRCVQDLCASSSPGVAWHYYQLTQGTGPGQIPYTPQPAPQPFDLSRIMSGSSIPAPINGTADKAGWVDQGNLRQGTTGPSSLQVVRLSPNIPSSASYFLMFWTGFLVPRTTGPYTFYTWWVDDSAYLWVGDKALSPTATNFDMHIRYASQDSYGVKRYTVNAVAGKPIPYTVLNVQSGGPFSLCFAIKENDRVIMNSCREAGEWPVATSEVVSCPNARFRPVFTA